jgi:hypothetical protein
MSKKSAGGEDSRDEERLDALISAALSMEGEGDMSDSDNEGPPAVAAITGTVASAGVNTGSVRQAITDHIMGNVRRAGSLYNQMLSSDRLRTLGGDAQIASEVILSDTSAFMERLREMGSAGRGAMQAVSSIATTTRSAVARNATVVARKATVVASNIYDVFLKAGGATYNTISAAVGKQSEDEIILAHELVMFMLIEAYIMTNTQTFSLQDATVEATQNALTDILNPTNEETESIRNQLVVHMKVAFDTFFLFKMGRSAIHGVYSPDVPEIQSANRSVRAAYVPRNNNDLEERLRREEAAENARRILNNPHEMRMYLSSIIGTFTTGRAPEPDHTRYFGAPMSPLEFVQSVTGEGGELDIDMDHQLIRLTQKAEHYRNNIDINTKTGNTVIANQRRLENIKEDVVGQIESARSSMLSVLGAPAIHEAMGIDQADTAGLKDEVNRIIVEAKEIFARKTNALAQALADDLEAIKSYIINASKKKRTGERRGDDEEKEGGGRRATRKTRRRRTRTTRKTRKARRSSAAASTSRKTRKSRKSRKSRKVKKNRKTRRGRKTHSR